MEDSEIWKDIPNYAGLYQVSNQGRVRSYDKYVRSRGGQRLIKGRILKYIERKQNEYLTVNLYKNTKLKHFYIHRIVLMAFDRLPKLKEQCNHKDGNKRNNKISNLEWCTPKENCDHSIRVLHNKIGRRGEKHPKAKLTDKKVREIRVHLKEGRLLQKEIAKKYDISPGIISLINTYKIWKHIQG